MKTQSAKEIAAKFRSDPENERLYRESEIRFELSDRMARMRKAGRLSQEELAERVGCRQPFIAKLEGGAYDKCEMSTLRTFARAMGHDIDIDAMFHSIEGKHYTGKSAASTLEAAVHSYAAACKGIHRLASARWADDAKLEVKVPHEREAPAAA